MHSRAVGLVSPRNLVKNDFNQTARVPTVPPKTLHSSTNHSHSLGHLLGRLVCWAVAGTPLRNRANPLRSVAREMKKRWRRFFKPIADPGWN